MMRIPEGTILCDLPLDACKSYPARLFKTHEEIRFAYADTSKNEAINLQVKYIPNGAKTTPHPQIIFFVKGDYHIEPWYNYGGKTDPFNWTTWMEWHLDARHLNKLLFALARCASAWEGKEQL